MLDLNFKPEFERKKKRILSFVPSLVLAVLLVILLILYLKQRSELKSIKPETPIITEEAPEATSSAEKGFDPSQLILRGIVGKDSIYLVLMEDLNSSGYIFREGDVISDWIVRYPGGDSVALVSIKGDRKYVFKLGGGIREETLR
ncbi:MAG: hypothetical protein J7L74_02305 [Candidatus Hydrothermae bacterium]|nr:hypothetical protein [Candidatus Hydrothermae bacterium]